MKSNINIENDLGIAVMFLITFCFAMFIWLVGLSGN